MFRIGLDVGQRNLMRAPEAFEPMSIHFQRALPSPSVSAIPSSASAARTSVAALPALLLMCLNFADAMLKRRSHRLMHAVGIGSLHEVGIPAIPA